MTASAAQPTPPRVPCKPFREQAFLAIAESTGMHFNPFFVSCMLTGVALNLRFLDDPFVSVSMVALMWQALQV